MNGKEISSYTALVWPTIEDEREASVQFSRDGKQMLPDEFNMTLKLYANTVKEPFIFTVPVKKAESLVTVQPRKTQKSGNFSYTVDYFQITPLAMGLKLHSEGKVPAAAQSKGRSSKMFYDIADEKGNVKEVTVRDNVIKQVPGLKSKEDLFYGSPFQKVPKTITIKPFTYTIDAKGGIVSEKGKWVKTYYKKLEMKVVVAK